MNMAYKFLLNDNGILFLLSDDHVDNSQDLHLILVGNDFYIKIDNTYSLLSDAVIEHIGHLSEKQQTINFAWYQSGDDTYEIKFLFAKELSRGDCSRLVVMHDLKRRGLFVNNQNSKIDTIENEILVTNEMK